MMAGGRGAVEIFAAREVVQMIMRESGVSEDDAKTMAEEQLKMMDTAAIRRSRSMSMSTHSVSPMCSSVQLVQ